MDSLIVALTPEGQPEPTPEFLEQRRQELAASNDPMALAAVAEGMTALGVSEANLRGNGVPTLALIGEIDPMRESVDALEGVMENVDVRVIPGADHMNAAFAPEFADGLLDFLSDHRAN